jgi:hypothetical protein
MLQIVVCEQCRVPLSKLIHIELDYKQSYCNSCGNGHTDKENHNFCSSKCLLLYLDIHKGFLCVSCHGTGDAFGFKSNGPCKVCNSGLIDI